MGCNILVLLLVFIVVVKSATLTPPVYPEGSFFTVKKDPNGVCYLILFFIFPFCYFIYLNLFYFIFLINNGLIIVAGVVVC